MASSLLLALETQSLQVFTPTDTPFDCPSKLICLQGVHSTGGNHTYPAQLGILLGDGYKVLIWFAVVTTE